MARTLLPWNDVFRQRKWGERINDKNLVALSRQQWLRQLQMRLDHRWLQSPATVLQLVDGLFPDHEHIAKQFATLCSQAFREGKLCSSGQIDFWLARSRLLKKVFAKSANILVDPGYLQDSQGYRWNVPQIANETELATQLLLGSHRILDWLTIPHRRRETEVTHYSRRCILKRDGTLRWIESPLPILKRTQRIIASDILNGIPLHDAASGFRPQRSVRQCAAKHVGRECLLRMDLRDFFGSIHIGRVCSMFRFAGYPQPVANRLAMLCTAPACTTPSCTTPACTTEVCNATSAVDPALARSRLPQGAPTSPALANAVCYSMDRRLSGFSKAMDATYTRYADDLVFSFDSRSVAQAKRIATSVAVIAKEEGFDVNHRKTRVMRQGNSQRVLGLTVNEKLNVPRKEYEKLKAIVHNCVTLGPDSQNRDDHASFRLAPAGSNFSRG